MQFTLSLLLTALPAVIAQAACPPLHFIYARATTEPPTNVDNATPEQWEAAANQVWSKGYGAAGYSMFSNITSLIPEATGWPVHYPASFTGCPSENKGIEDMLSRLTTIAAQCPDTLFALGGHSQGGVVTVRTIPQIPADIMSRIVSITMVGSPACPSSVREKCRSYCNLGDLICMGSGSFPGTCETGRTSPPLTTEDVEGFAALAEKPFVGGRAPDCSGPEPREKGHLARGEQSAHLAYNEDGFYVKAAACFVQKKFLEAGGRI